LLAAMEGGMLHTQTQGWVWIVDGKPLVVGGYSKDPEAKLGYAVKGFAKGYKLHAIYGPEPLPVAWELTPMNTAEPEVAIGLIGRVGCAGYLIGDKSYDHNALHQVATDHGCQLVAQRKRPNTGLGHGKQAPGRLRSMALLQGAFGKALHACRDEIERSFGWLTNHGCGLAPLPAWVRRLDRAIMWVQAKMLGHFVYAQLHRAAT
jgi:hypothetical protein